MESMLKIRVHDLAKKIGLTNEELIAHLRKSGYSIANQNDTIPLNKVDEIERKIDGDRVLHLSTKADKPKEKPAQTTTFKLPSELGGMLKEEGEYIEVRGTPYLVHPYFVQVKLLRLAKDLMSYYADPLQGDDKIAYEKELILNSVCQSNGIEGSSLDLGSTREIIAQKGITIAGHSVEDHLSTRNLFEAHSWVNEFSSSSKVITESDILHLHSLVMHGEMNALPGKYRNIDVEIKGSASQPPNHFQVSNKMRSLLDWFNQHSAFVSPTCGIVVASVFHAWFERIHPFKDGNGRVGRLLMNLILVRSNVPIAIIEKEERGRYYDALEESQHANMTPFFDLVVDNINENLVSMKKMVKDIRQAGSATGYRDKLVASISEEGDDHLRNHYDVWCASMNILKSKFKSEIELLAISVEAKGRISALEVRGDHDMLTFEKWKKLRNFETISQSWFFQLVMEARGKTFSVTLVFRYPWRNFDPKDGLDVVIGMYYRGPNDYSNQSLVPETPMSYRQFGFSRTRQQWVCIFSNPQNGRLQVKDVSMTDSVQQIIIDFWNMASRALELRDS